MGIDIKNSDWNTYKHVTDVYVTRQILINETGKNPDKKIIELIIDHYAKELSIQMNIKDTSFTTIPGVKEMFDYFNINSTEYQTGIATGGFLKTARYKLDMIGINFSEDHIYSSNNYDTKQEMISAFIHQQNYNGLTFDKIIYVGDREYDYKVTKDLNIDFIGIDFKGNGKLKALGIEKVINNYEPIEKFLELI